MKYAFINPPGIIWNVMPHTGIPYLMKNLEENNIDSCFFDFNLEYINNILFSEDGIKMIIQLYDNFFYNDNLVLNDYIKNFKIIEKENFQNKKKYILNNIDKIEYIKYISSKKNLFYNPVLQSFHYRFGFSLIYFAYKLEKYVYDRELNLIETKGDFDFDLLKNYFENKLNSFYTSFLDKKIDDILKYEPNCIGISVNTIDNFIPALYISKIIKEKTNIHINIGGYCCNTLKKCAKLPEILYNHIDTMSFGDNYKTVIDLCKYLNREININEVENICYIEKNEILFNKSYKKYNINNIKGSLFNGYKKENYLMPELVMPIQASINCYWGKCIFCMCTMKERNLYQIRDVENIVNEIEYLQKKYNTKYFCFWDNALHPKYLDKLAEIIIKHNLKINYSIYARFEKSFDNNLFKKLYKSGLRYIYWGLDSASEHVIKYINKGIKLNEVQKILKYSNDNKIYNSVYIILGHPTETIEDLENDFIFINKNKYNIDKIIVIPSVIFEEGTILTNQSRNKEMIYTTKEQRKEYENKIYKIIPKRYEQPGADFLTVCNKYKNKNIYRFIQRIYNFILFHEKLNLLYIKFHFCLYKIKFLLVHLISNHIRKV